MDSAVSPLTGLAPAKINLALHVTGRLADGYHSLESLVVFTRFGDRLGASSSEEDKVGISGRYGPQLADDENNLIVKARDALRRQAGSDKAPPVHITLEKNLPIASGIGGGSSDAAAVLRMLGQGWGIESGLLGEVARSLGADVPMCMEARPLVARGIGQDTASVQGFPQLALVLVNPGVAVSTPDVFAALKQRENPGLPPLPKQFDFHSLRNWLDTTRNDLETPARELEPGIGKVLKTLDKAGSAFSRMSGSGATCFGLFETNNMAKRAAAEIRSRQPDWFVAATRSIASEDQDHGQD
ncbi:MULTISPECIES: 4-(cytidine 5'-diphospho)-2-C-methyl-D-erythritol kinase [unclassified Mesorhizobium]|uniref:4-(cytidine 5'-diphospho)-2-C-methyl-D-erythritol kinase n=1 Tax=unclassified Mesorhizobium TaxID=325217 RepID=UPI0006FDD62A|nr:MULTISPECIES: 4-(cytidine 5'-diphospho)-2-C-methyl-D-erythritol kinase [unclassified Mesorhizobium]KQZ12812.1 4-diphosphocytidyl-2C-methyl-D-erythritol kinase [Mesorhizobium sp. Root1471]KQZ35332.1 4-diphosphocytidyl-2C-methyl-D-erythritol kinase [Mesorhizobium sp. Root554]MDR7031571.1 4-diphosphocytidyl-2-C-methyl-D-erythritol kinase [Mesorhizobium sp. BE184]